MHDVEEKQIVILGMHRSGTSILSHTLSNLGVNMGNLGELGEKSLIGNVDGHYEDLDFLYLNERILEKLETSWKKPPSISQVKDNSRWIESEYSKLVNTRTGVWGVKEPRLSLFCEPFSRLLSNPFYIYMERNPSDVAKSIHVRDGVSLDDAEALKEEYDVHVKAFLSDKDYLKVSYENLIKDPLSQLKLVTDFLGLEFDVDAVAHIRSKKDLRKKKKSALMDIVKDSFKAAIKNPKKVLSKAAISRVSRIYRRVIELYFSKSRQ